MPVEIEVSVTMKWFGIVTNIELEWLILTNAPSNIRKFIMSQEEQITVRVHCILLTSSRSFLDEYEYNSATLVVVGAEKDENQELFESWSRDRQLLQLQQIQRRKTPYRKFYLHWWKLVTKNNKTI